MPRAPRLRRAAAAPGFSGPSRDAARPRTEVFTFATRLTRLTPYLAAATPETMLARAGQAAPDWAGGTRIGAALREFNDRYGTRGMARGAVVLIISDGWETGDPALVGAQMARLHRVAYRIVWANPRTQSDRYRPEVGGMAAAWPYCDAVVSAHNFESLDELLAALRAPRVHRPSFVPALYRRCRCSLALQRLSVRSMRRPVSRRRCPCRSPGTSAAAERPGGLTEKTMDRCVHPGVHNGPSWPRRPAVARG